MRKVLFVVLVSLLIGGVYLLYLGQPKATPVDTQEYMDNRPTF